MAKKRNVVLSVSNDLYTDPRVDKVCNFLVRNGFSVTLVGRQYRQSPSLEKRAYKTYRMFLLFKKGAAFYAEFNFRLFWLLLFKKCDILVANDLDTLLPNLLVSKLRKKRLIYDSHEYFCGMLSLANRPRVRKTWLAIEKFCFPKLKEVITVSQSIVDQYYKEYGIKAHLVRNIPTQRVPVVTETKASLGLPTDRPIIILQGNGINEGRGGEEIIDAMPFVERAFLIIVGNGTVIPALKQRVENESLQDSVRFIGRVTPEYLYNYTYLSDVGLALDRDISANLRFSLPNKIFEYLRAHTPLIVSNLTERAHIIDKYQTGLIVEQLDGKSIAEAINRLTSDKELYEQCKANCIKAAGELTWENEEKELEKIYLNPAIS